MAFLLQLVWRCLGYSDIGEFANETLAQQNAVCLDQHRSGSEAVVVKNGKRLCGSGGCLANAEIVQDKSYFEAKLQSNGIWGVGLAVSDESVDKCPLGDSTLSWVLRNDGKICHNKKAIHESKLKFEEGDVIGCSFDHVELNFFVNGKALNLPLRGIKGALFPAFYVDGNAILDIEFANFTFSPPSGYQNLMLEKTIF